jgi:hypothetical protein
MPDVGGSGGGNSRGERNNNRGNLKFGPLARSFGATHADDRGFAVFPDQASGDAAQSALLQSSPYRGLSLKQFGGRYAEGSAEWIKTVGREMGLGPNDIVNGGDPRLPGAIRKAEGTNGGATSSPSKMGIDGVKAFIMHHTGGRGTVAGVQQTLRQRGLGVEYVMDRDGNITQTGGRGAANIMPGWGPKGVGLNNKNILGMEVIAKNDRDVTAAQIKAAKAFIDKNYPDLPVFGHGEVNPGHKEADEGMSIVNAIRDGRANAFTNPHGLGGAHLSDRAKHGTHHKLSVDFNNMPKGTRTGYSGDAGLFKEVKLNRGRAMGFASQDS